MFLKPWTPLEAIEWLGRQFLAEELGKIVKTISTGNADRRQNEVKQAHQSLHRSCSERWPALKAILVKSGSTETVIDNLSSKGVIHATPDGFLRTTLQSHEKRAGYFIQEAPESSSPPLMLTHGKPGLAIFHRCDTLDMILLLDPFDALVAVSQQSEKEPKEQSNIVTIPPFRDRIFECLLKEAIALFEMVKVVLGKHSRLKGLICTMLNQHGKMYTLGEYLTEEPCDSKSNAAKQKGSGRIKFSVQRNVKII